MVSKCLIKKMIILKKEMELTVQKNDFNFLHPEVIRSSQRLDILINKVMKNEFMCCEDASRCTYK